MLYRPRETAKLREVCSLAGREMASQIPRITKTQIDTVFADDAMRDHAKDYLAGLQTNMETTETTFRRTLTHLALLLAVFYLLTEAVVTKVSVLGFEVEDLTPIQNLLPVAIAYGYYELCAQCVMRGILRDTFGAIYQKLYGPFHFHGLDDYLLATSPWLTEEIVHLKRRRSFFTPIFIVFRTYWALIIIYGGFFGFVIVTYGLLFSTPGSDLIRLLSFVVSAIFFLQGVVMVLTSDTYNV